MYHLYCPHRGPFMNLFRYTFRPLLVTSQVKSFNVLQHSLMPATLHVTTPSQLLFWSTFMIMSGSSMSSANFLLMLVFEYQYPYPGNMLYHITSILLCSLDCQMVSAHQLQSPSISRPSRNPGGAPIASRHLYKCFGVFCAWRRWLPFVVA